MISILVLTIDLWSTNLENTIFLFSYDLHYLGKQKVSTNKCGRAIISVFLSLRIKRKGPLSGLRQFMTTESLLKMIKNDFCFMLKDLFVFEIFTFLSQFFGYVEKLLDKKIKFSSKIYDVADWTTSNYNTHIAQYLKK